MKERIGFIGSEKLGSGIAVNDGLPKFAMRNALMNLPYLAAFAHASAAAHRMGAAVRNGFATGVATGCGERYAPALCDMVTGLNGVSLREPAGKAAKF